MVILVKACCQTNLDSASRLYLELEERISAFPRLKDSIKIDHITYGGEGWNDGWREVFIDFRIITDKLTEAEIMQDQYIFNAAQTVLGVMQTYHFEYGFKLRVEIFSPYRNGVLMDTDMEKSFGQKLGLEPPEETPILFQYEEEPKNIKKTKSRTIFLLN